MACFFSVYIIAIADYYSAYKLTFSTFYLLPILVALRISGKKAGIAFSFFVVVTWLCVDLLSQKHQYIHIFVPFWNACVRLVFYLIVVWISLKWQEQARESQVDGLTSVLNRKGFMANAEREVSRCQRYHHSISLAYIDVDDFKEINDQYGHHHGDMFLVTLAKTLQKGCRSTDFVARMGGDEFAILMPETTEAGAHTLMVRLRQLTRLIHQHVHGVTVSIGVATFLSAPASASQMIKAADGLMYSVKKKGKNQMELKAFK